MVKTQLSPEDKEKMQEWLDWLDSKPPAQDVTWADLQVIWPNFLKFLRDILFEDVDPDTV